MPRACQHKMLQKKVDLKQFFLTKRHLTLAEAHFFLPVVCSPEPLTKGSCPHLLLAQNKLILLNCGSDGSVVVASFSRAYVTDPLKNLK